MQLKEPSQFFSDGDLDEVVKTKPKDPKASKPDAHPGEISIEGGEIVTASIPTESPVVRDATSESPRDLDPSASDVNNATIANASLQDAASKTNKTILPMIVKTDNGYIYWLTNGTASSALSNSVGILFAVVLIRVWLL